MFERSVTLVSKFIASFQVTQTYVVTMPTTPNVSKNTMGCSAPVNDL